MENLYILAAIFNILVSTWVARGHLLDSDLEECKLLNELKNAEQVWSCLPPDYIYQSQHLVSKEVHCQKALSETPSDLHFFYR